MSIAQHTNGAWAREVSLRAIDLERLGFSINFINTDSAARKDVARANARLIDAAPELLNELQEVLEWATKERAPLREQEIKSISALIAKATRSAA